MGTSIIFLEKGDRGVGISAQKKGDMGGGVVGCIHQWEGGSCVPKKGWVGQRGGVGLDALAGPLSPI